MPRISRRARTTLQLVKQSGGPFEAVKRLAPAEELTPEQRDEWLRIVGNLPADWFTAGNTALIVQYCRHVVMARRVAAMIETMACNEGVDVKRLGTLMRIQQRETSVIRTVMTALRLTPRAVQPSRVSIKQLQRMPTPWSG